MGTITPERDSSSTRDCHGSTVNPEGHVTVDPAKRDLPFVSSVANVSGRLIASVPAG
jgi:hypothetical protein